MESLIQRISSIQNYEQYADLNWSGSFEEYLKVVQERPEVTRTAYQRLYDMILSYGSEERVDNKKQITHYFFFDDPRHGGRDAVFGMEIPLMRLVHILKSAAMGYGAQKRIILLHGPVGSAKSTIARLLKQGLEEYSQTQEGAMFTYEWQLPPELQHITGGEAVFSCPMNEEPLRLIPADWRAEAFERLGLERDGRPIKINGDLNPACRLIFRELMSHYEGDWSKVISHVRVKRLVLSERDRVGIGTFQPKDEKNQDATELTGDINYKKIALFGSDSDPRAFNFDGEFNIANRGLIEFVEILKLDVAFLYDLLGATQEQKIKPKKFPQTDIDEVIIGHTNEAEYRKLLNNEFMEALRDRTIKVDIPYITRYAEEVRIYKKDFSGDKLRGMHVAPHTLEMAAMWGILTRLEEPKRHDLTLLQKLKLYDGKLIEGFTQDNVKELRKETSREGLDGISPRYIQDKISNALVHERATTSINPFLVLNELASGLKQNSMITDEKLRERLLGLIDVVREEYDEVVKREVQRAISADEDAIKRLCANYIDHIKAYTQKERVKNPYTGQDEAPDERLMRSIESKIDISDSRKDDFRREIMNYIGALALEGRTFSYDTNDRLRGALEKKLFEDQKDTIKLTSLVSNAVDRETQEKIEVVRQRLIRDFGYNDESAADVLQYVASIFARGDTRG
jgi:serine protein kinase